MDHDPGAPSLPPRAVWAPLTTLLDHMPVGVALFDRTHRVVRVNPLLADDAAARPEPAGDRLGPPLTLREVMARDGGWIEAHLDRVFDTGERVEGGEVGGRGADGRTWTLELFPVCDEYHQVVLVGVVVVEASAGGRPSLSTPDEDRLRGLLDALLPFAAVLAPDGVLLEVGRPALDAAALEVEAVVGRPFDETYWWSYDGRVRARVRDAVERASRGETVRYEVEARVARDRFLTIDFMLAPLRDGSGVVRGLVASGADVSDRLRVEEALEVSEASLATVAESLPQIVWTSAPEGGTDYLNRRWEEYTGRRVEASLAGGWRAHLHPDDVEATRARWWAARRTGEPFEVEHRLRAADGASRWHLTRAVPVRDTQGRVQKWFGTSTDIHEQRERIARADALATELEARVRDRTAELERQARRLEEANRELEAFSYSVSHDLRAPLRGIDGFSQALLEDYGAALDDTARRYLLRVREGAQRMGRLIDDLLVFSQLSRSEVNSASVDLGALATPILERLAERDPGREVEARIAPGLSAVGDAQLLTIILENLLGNAWKFTSKRPRAVIVLGESSDMPGTFFVGDNGAGFDMAYVDKIFGAFQRLHSSRDFEGTGIGLATVERIVRRHGGRVWAEAEVDVGATFYFTLGATDGG